ncbi:MAG TPA: DUF3606 domain-containing protein [Burkholderiales bacterium]|nr:DUF3606 domain-containing protein [Burkholderiales bacterium]
MDDTTRGRSQDRSKVNLHEDYEVRYWTQALGVSEEQLAQAVKAVGNSADRVREYFSNQAGR